MERIEMFTYLERKEERRGFDLIPQGKFGLYDQEKQVILFKREREMATIEKKFCSRYEI